MKCISVAAVILFAVTANALAWTEKDLLGDWKQNAGVEVLRLGTEHKFEVRDGIHFLNVKGEFAIIDDGIRVTMGGSDLSLKVVRLTDTELVLRAANETTDTVYKRQAASVIETADELRSLDGFRLGMNSAEIFAMIKNQKLQLINESFPVRGNATQNMIPGSDYSMYGLPNSSQLIIAKRLLFWYQKGDVADVAIAIDFYAPPLLSTTPSLNKLNVAIRIERIRFTSETKLAISDVSKEYTEKFGRPWSQSANSAIWYLTSAGTAPGMLTRIMSENCDDVGSYVRMTEIMIGLKKPPDKQPDHCGIGVAVEIASTHVASISKDGELSLEERRNVITTKFDNDLVRRLAAERYRFEQVKKQGLAK